MRIARQIVGADETHRDAVGLARDVERDFRAIEPHRAAALALHQPAVQLAGNLPLAFAEHMVDGGANRGKPPSDLAFRRTRDPYAILVSEAMAQQTQAARAAAYWERFLERFPTVEALAAATPADVFRAWQGLGYALLRQDRNREAVEALTAALEVQPDSATEALLARTRKGMADERGMAEQQLSHFHVRYDGEEHAEVGLEIAGYRRRTPDP